MYLHQQENSQRASSVVNKTYPAAYKSTANTPLWALPSAWHEANKAIDHLIRIYDKQLETAKSLAITVQKNIETISPILDQLNSLTCPWCPDPCCITTKIWFDFKDLVFLHLNGLDIPSAQLIKNIKGSSCHYKSSKGCTLNRINRPWVCTWYLCPTQTAILRKNDHQAGNKISTTFKRIKDSRRTMEEKFIQITSGKE